MTPTVYILIMAGGTDDNHPMSLAPRWVDDPYGEFTREYIRAKAWCDYAGQSSAICWFQPCGYPREPIMRFDAASLMRTNDRRYYDQVCRIVREFAPLCDWPLMIYLGSLASYEWTQRYDIVRCVAPYVMQGRTSLMLDAMADATVEGNMRPLDGLRHAFDNVACEGQYRTSNPWIRNAGYRNIITADWQPGNPYLYIPTEPGDYMLISDVPDSMKGVKATDEERAAWRRKRCGEAMRAGLHPIIGVSNIIGWTPERLMAG